MTRDDVHADNERRTALLTHIQQGELTLEEAAQSLAGFRLKAMQRVFPGRTADDHGTLYRAALVDLESRLPGWQGCCQRPGSGRGPHLYPGREARWQPRTGSKL